ncbi:MAG TPA: patatin-like phospholipase family protein [Steroidobacteraceae bacterium]|nr:patatin-like phospholipase family protein [Steroidobacteraceae bacterium]
MSPGTDTIIQGAIDSRNVPAMFAALPLLRELAGDLLAEITQEIEWFSLPGGTTLYKAGQAPDGLYVVVNGGLGVYVPRSGGGSRLAAQVPGGQLIGETEAVSGNRRASTVVALRDTEVARLPTALIERLIARNPGALRQIAKILVQRLEAAQIGDRQPRARSKTFTVVPHGPDVDAEGFGRQLLQCLKELGKAELVSRSTGSEQTSHWFHRLERANDFVVYVTDFRPSNWSKLCLRQADSLLLLANGEVTAHAWPALLARDEQPDKPQRLELVLQHRSGSRRAATRPWIDLYPCRHHHVSNSADIARVARTLTGRAVGLVLSGGGARGLAHIGVMRAIREAHIPIDGIGATSIGAIIGGGWAAGWDYPEMLQRIRRSFVDTNPTSDYTLPLLSLLSGRKVGRLLRREFGETNIEDLPLPYYCVSTNLTSGQAAVHRRGPVWLWSRASVAIPGVLPPVIADGQVYVDGATISNLPVDIMREVLDGPVIAVDAGADRAFATDLELTETPPMWGLPGWRRLRRSRINIMQILWRAGMVNSAATTIGQRELADLLLKPPTDNINLLDWKSFERAIEVGYRHASEALEKRDWLQRRVPAGAPETRSAGQ